MLVSQTKGTPIKTTLNFGKLPYIQLILLTLLLLGGEGTVSNMNPAKRPTNGPPKNQRKHRISGLVFRV